MGFICILMMMFDDDGASEEEIDGVNCVVQAKENVYNNATSRLLL
jgi:hypothetical protein